MAVSCPSCGGLIPDIGRPCSNCGQRNEKVGSPPILRTTKGMLFLMVGVLLGGLGMFQLLSPHQLGNGDGDMILAVMLIGSALGAMGWGYFLLN